MIVLEEILCKMGDSKKVATRVGDFYFNTLQEGKNVRAVP